MATNSAGQDAVPGPAKEPEKQEPDQQELEKAVPRGRYARLKLSIGRHPSDLLRMAIAAGVVLGCRLVAASSGINPVEAAISSQVELLPPWTTRGWEVITWLGWWPGIAAAVILALYPGRVRMGVSLALAGVTSWFLAVVIQLTVAPRPVPSGLEPALLRGPGPHGFLFPDERTAVIAALVTVAAPYLARPSRIGSWILVVLVAMADIFLGHHLPLDVFAGGVLGWGTGILLHVVLGAPGRRTSESAVYLALRQAGLEGARIVSVQRRELLRPQEYELCTREGARLQMKIVRRMHRRAGPTYKLRRILASLEVEHDPGLSTPRHEVEHEAYMTLLAERAGIGTLPVVFAGEIEHGPPFLIRRYINGRPLSDFSANEVSDGLLDRIWSDIRKLGKAHIAHHDLRAQNILIDAQGRPHIADFTFSRVGGPGQRWQDAAEMLVSIAAVVGPERAITSARRALPRKALKGALPHLQRLTLHRKLRRQLSSGNETLAVLRESLAEQIDTPVPSLRSPVRPTTVAILLAGGLAVYLLLPEFSSMDEVLVLVAHGNWLWLGAAVLTGFLGVLASATSVLGSSPTRLPVRKTIAVQFAAAFTGRTTTAGIGFYAINWIYMEKVGLRRANAVAVIALNRIVMGFVSAVGTALGLVVIGNAIPFQVNLIPTGWPVPVIGAAVVAAAIFLGSPYGRRRILRPGMARGREIVRELVPTLRHPLRAAQLFGGCAAYLLLSAAGLATTLAAFTPDFPLLPVLAVFIVGSTLGQLVPTPGGLGAVEAAMIAGLTAIGITPADSVAAVLASRVLTFWLPVLPGIVVFRILQHRGIV